MWWLWMSLVACDHGMSSPPCTGADCPCPETALQCDGTCIDVSSDPANCGGCAHDCLGGACSAGACAPELIATVPGIPAALIATDHDLVFATTGPKTSSGVLYRIPKTGGTPTVLLRGLGAEAALGVDGDRILVADSGLSDSCSPSYGGGAILSVRDIDDVTLEARGRRCARYLVPHATGLFWVEESPTTTFNTGDLLPWVAFLPIGSSPETVPSQLAGRGFIRDLHLVNAGEDLMWRFVSTLQKMPRGGGPALTVADPVDRFAVSGDRLAFIGDDRLVMRSLGTGSEMEIAQVSDPVRAMAIDASFVYWTTAGELWVADPANVTSRQLATLGSGFLPDDQTLVQDELFLYALQHSSRGTSIVRIRKPASATPFTGEPVCRGPLRTCSDEPFSSAPCVDVRSDPDNCGDCGTICGTGEVCTSGACVCGPAALVCGGTCVDPTSDPSNCGACGRSCGAGTCAGGDCAPMPVASGGMAAAVHDASAVYFSQGHDVKRFDKQTNQVTTLHTFMYARALAVDATRLYVVETSGTIGVTNPGTIHALSKDGQSIQALYTARPDPRDLAVVGSNVVWIEDASDASETPATMAYGASTGGGTVGSVRPLGLYSGANDDRSVDVAVAGSSAFWLLGDPNALRGAIVRVDFATMPPAVSLVAELTGGYPASITVRGTELYVTVRSTDSFMLSVSTSGGTPTLVAKVGQDATALETTADGTVMWIDGQRPHFFVRELAAGALTPRTVASELDDPTAILPDADRFYVATFAGLMVVR